MIFNKIFVLFSGVPVNYSNLSDDDESIKNPFTDTSSADDISVSFLLRICYCLSSIIVNMNKDLGSNLLVT